MTTLTDGRLVDQTITNLVQLQRDMAANATSHKAMAAAQSPDVTTLGAQVTACAADYQRRVGWQISLFNDATNSPMLTAGLALRGMTPDDVKQQMAQLRQVAGMLAAQPIATYADITAACNLVLASVSPPPSVWPE